MSEDAEPGVYLDDGAGRWRCIHRYEDGDYGLEQVVELFGLGERVPDPEAGDEVLVEISGHEAAQLKAMADAQSFDHEPEFIEMCVAIAHNVPPRAGRTRLRGNF